MPYKHDESHRHKIENARYKVANSPEYNKALRQAICSASGDTQRDHHIQVIAQQGRLA